MNQRKKTLKITKVKSVKIDVTTNSVNDIKITVLMKFPQLKEVKGNGFKLTDDVLTVNTNQKEYGKKIKELQAFIYKIINITVKVEEKISKLDKEKNDSTNTSNQRSSNSK